MVAPWVIPAAVTAGNALFGAIAGGGEEVKPIDFGEFMKDFQEGGKYAPKRFGLSDQELALAQQGYRDISSASDIGMARGLSILSNARRGSSAQAASMGLQAASLRQQRSLELTRRIAALAEESRTRQQLAFQGLGIQAYGAVSDAQAQARQAELQRQQMQWGVFGDVVGSVSDAVGNYELLSWMKKLKTANTIPIDIFSGGTEVPSITPV